jgi:hypothetical protein
MHAATQDMLHQPIRGGPTVMPALFPVIEAALGQGAKGTPMRCHGLSPDVKACQHPPCVLACVSHAMALWQVVFCQELAAASWR